MKTQKLTIAALAGGIMGSIVASCVGGTTPRLVTEKPYEVTTTESVVPAKVDTLQITVDKAAKKGEQVQVKTITTPEYTRLEKTQVDLSVFPKDKDGWITIFCNSFYGWRGYGKDVVPSRWVVEDGTIRFQGTGMGEGQKNDGGDIIFAYKFQNFELSIDWKAAPGTNSGIFYLAQEIKGEPIYISAPEAQVLDNERHPDAKLGVDGNRMSSSLYDMIPAKPQNAKPAGEWNTTKIMVYKGTVVHWQNGVQVLEYHLWTQQWIDLLQASKFSKERWPLAFELLSKCGGESHSGYIGLQDHGDDVWFKNIKVKVLE